MTSNTYFKVILFEIFVFEYDFRCTRTRVRFGRTRTHTRTRRVGTRTRTRTRESPYLPSSVSYVINSLLLIAIKSNSFKRFNFL